jgi:hypothetical protein
MVIEPTPPAPPIIKVLFGLLPCKWNFKPVEYGFPSGKAGKR